MNQTTIALILGFVAGIVGGYFGQSIAGAAGGDATLEASEVESLKKQLAELQTAMRERDAARGATLASRANEPALLEADATSVVLTAEQEAALLAKVDERVAKAMEEQGATIAVEGGSMRSARPRRKRVNLATAAAELEMTSAQEDALRRLYEEQERKMLEILAAPDGDPEDVKRELEEARRNPGSAQGLIGKYLPKVFPKHIGTIMTMQTERQKTINDTLGPEKAKRYREEYRVEEDDMLGMGGGGGMNFETRMGAGR